MPASHRQSLARLGVIRRPCQRKQTSSLNCYKSSENRIFGYSGAELFVWQSYRIVSYCNTDDSRPGGGTAAPGATQRPRVQGAEILLQGAEFYLLIGQSTGYVLRPNYFQGKQNERVQIVDLVGYGGLAASRGPSKCPSFPSFEHC